MNIRKHLFMKTVAVIATATFMACGDDDAKQDYNPLIDNQKTEEEQTEKPAAQSGYAEQYRPQVHYTPAKNWVNDPNGLVYVDGTYHLFYQYNPMGNDWGNMSWGHATSTDLMHWKEQPVALQRDELGAIFSGSCVIDKDNTANFGAGAMVAFYTSAGETGSVAGKQQQSLAYSTDGGKTFTRFTSNPVIKNDDDNLRDPKVFWHEGSKQWIMALAKGWKRGVDFYGSANLKQWQYLSTFVTDLAGRPNLQWECPDLIQMGDKWVLLVSVNPGGPILGSGIMYFTGQFDGRQFTADERSYPLWLDYGTDNYAGVTWSNTGNRRVMIGWMNNWSYAGAVPSTPWRSAFTLPRELKLVQVGGELLLSTDVVKEVDAIAGQWQTVEGGQLFDKADAYQLQLTVGLDKNTTVTLANAEGELFSFDINGASRSLTSHRTSKSGQTSFNGTFSVPSMRAPLNVEGNEVTIDLYVDQSSVELLSNHGAMSQTMLVYPSSIYNQLSVSGATATVRVRQLKSIWK